MDDIWQRHKSFIVQCMIGGFVFLIALIVKSQMYGDDVPKLASTNASLKSDLVERPGPSKSSIDTQLARAEEAQKQTLAMAGSAASLASGADAHAKESIAWLLHTLGRSNQLDQFFTMYKATPQTCLSRLREEARTVLLGEGAVLGKEIDESLGITSGFEENEVRLGLHGLALVADVVKRALALEGIETIGPLAISPRARPSPVVGQDSARATVFSVRVGLTGEPEAVNALLRSFNTRDNHVNRLTVLDTLESIQRIRKEEDLVRASFYLYGIQYRGIDAGGAN